MDRCRSYSGPVPEPRDRRRAAPAVLLAIAILLGACGSHDAGRAAPPTSTTVESPVAAQAVRPAGIPDDWRPGPLDWHICADDQGTECATLQVPLDWSEPSGASIGLALARKPATGGPGRRIGSVVTNPGGPGGSGVAFISSSPFDAAVAERFDQVSWDPRGVGDSNPVTCAATTAPEFLEADPDPDTPEEQARLDALAEQVSSDCARTDAKLLVHISTMDVARDLEAIRRALGDGPLNYVGFSYGTQIGQTYAEMFPQQIRTMVLDGVVDPSLSFTAFLMGQIDGFDAAFDRNVERCARAGRSVCGVADLAAAYDRLHERVERRRRLPTRSGATVGPAELAVAATYVAYRNQGWQQLGPAIAAGLAGDGSLLRSLADSYHDLGGYGVYAGVVCSDSQPPSTPAAWNRFADAARKRSPRFGGTVANELLPCATWPVKAAATGPAITADGAPPILVIGNTGDPATPIANARAVAGRLRSGVLVTVDRDGHTAYGSNRCVTRIVDRYLTDGTVPAAGTAC